MKRGGERRRKAPAAYTRGGSAPEKTELGLPGVESSGIWAVRGLRDTRSPPGAFAGLGEVRGGACCDGGGFAWRSIAGVRSRRLWGALLTKVASAEGRGGCCVAHRGSNRGMAWRRVSASCSGGEARLGA